MKNEGRRMRKRQASAYSSFFILHFFCPSSFTLFVFNIMDYAEKGSKTYLFTIVLVAVLGGLLFGYDTAVISGAEKGLQAFFLGADDFVYTDGWHGFTCASALIGCIIGSAVSGYMASNWGRKNSLIFAGVMFFISAMGSMVPEFLFFEHGVPTYPLLIAFNIYRVIGGVVVYMVNFFILGDHTNPVIESIGQGINAVAPGSDPWTISTGWRYMFGSEAVPAGLFALLICFVPETPRYLVMAGQDNKALAVLCKINGKAEGANILDEIKNTITEKTEKVFTYGVLVIFVGIMLSVFQQAVGINAVLYYAPRIFGDMGMENPMMQTIIMGVVNILFTLIAIFTVEKWGRKPLLVTGSAGMAVGAFGVAVTFGHAGLELVTMLSIMVYSASFMMSWGPICWVLISEIFPNTIRGAAVAIAVAFQWIFNWIVSASFVPMFNMQTSADPNFGHWFTYGLYGVICVLAALFVWRLVPETKGKTLEDMSNLWKNRK